MNLTTKHFGELQIDEAKIINFSEGIPGFPNNKQYVLIFDDDDPNSPFCWLQSIDDGNIAFALVNPLTIYPNYAPKVDEEIVATLGEPKVEHLALYTIVVVPQDIAQMTANLKAPIIINTKTKKGMQIVAQNEEYEIKYKIFNDIQQLSSTKEGV